MVSQLLVTASSSSICISKVDDESARIHPLIERNLFATITLLFPISSDSFGILSDSGSLTMATFTAPSKLQFQQRDFGRSGLRRVSLCYGACDSQSRVILTSAVERTRYVFVLVDGSLGGPIDCSRDSVVYDLCAVDVGFANPIFCILEATRAGKFVSFYVFDLGLNVLRLNQSIEYSDAQMLVSLPESLHGVLVCRKDYIDYLSSVSTRKALTIAFPGRAVSAVVHVTKAETFALVQSETGSVFKLLFHKDPELTLTLQYFAQLNPSSSLHVFKAGFLFSMAQRGDHTLHQFNSLGEEDPVLAYSQADDHKCTIEPIGPTPDNLELMDTLLSLKGTTCLRLGASRQKVQEKLLLGAGSALRSIQHAVPTDELVSTSLAKDALDVFVAGNVGGFSELIIVSFNDDILVLKVSESVQEIKDSGLVKARTFFAGKMEGSLVQVHTKGIRQIGGKTTDWTPPKPIKLCSADAHQALVALEDNILLYFEFTNGVLKQKLSEKLDEDITALSLAQTPPGRLKATYASVAVGENLRIFTIDDALQLTSMQVLPGTANSIYITSDLVMHVGLVNGVYMQNRIESNSGAVLSTKRRVLGVKPVRISSAWEGDTGKNCVIVSSDKTWAVLPSHKFDMVPLTHSFTSVDKFSTEDTPKALVGVSGRSIRFFTLENLKARYMSSDTAFTSPPLRMAGSNILLKDSVIVNNQATKLPEGVKAVAFATCRFECRKQEFVVVSALRNARYEHFQLKYDSAELLVYAKAESGLELVHTTTTPGCVSALAAFKGRLLVGVGANLIIYDIGLKQLLKKETFETSGSRIVSLAVNRNRIFVGDAQRSVIVLAYAGDTSTGAVKGFVVVCDDPISRQVSCLTVLDFDTVAVGDRFGNFSVLRVPSSAGELSSDDRKLVLLAAKPPHLNGAHYKLDLIAQFYLGDVVTGMQLGVFSPGSTECLCWAGVNGSIGLMAPLEDSDIELLGQLEAEMRNLPPAIGRSHLAYRSYGAPVKNVIDGDLCEEYGTLPIETKERVAQRLKTQPEVIEQRVAELRTRYMQ